MPRRYTLPESVLRDIRVRKEHADGAAAMEKRMRAEARAARAEAADADAGDESETESTSAAGGARSGRKVAR
jgi:hypothetical protein